MDAVVVPRRSRRAGRVAGALVASRRSRSAERAVAAVVAGRLRPPALRSGVVERPRLVERLNDLTRASVTVVAAPTGYGKTTLLASWAAVEPRPLAWASVGSEDLDAAGFWALVLAALEQAEPRLAFGLRSAGRRVDDRAIVIAAALESLTRDVVLVLDGYEQATRTGVDATFRRFLDVAPATLHVVVSTRGQPELGLALRRARGTVGELSARDLRLDDGETAAVLHRTLGGGVTGAAAALAERTEGWPAAVYLAALAARTESQPVEALGRFSGAARDVSDYLRLELLDAQPDDALRSFLLETSVLERLSAPLCDALLHCRDSDAMLRRLVRGGAFLVPVGEAGEYRHVRPVAEFLRAELARVAPERLGDLHRRAAAACERAGLVDDAAVHARIAGGDAQGVAVLSRHALELVRAGRTEHLEQLLATRAGAAAVQRRPALPGELRLLAAADSDPRALSMAARRVGALCGGLPGGPLKALVQSTAQAAHAYTLLLSGRVADAYEAGTAAYAAADPEAPAAIAQAAAVASLAAAQLGLRAVAAPLARASASALVSRRIRSGTAAALSALADAAVSEGQGDFPQADRLCEEALERADEPAPRALALLQLSRLRGDSLPDARTALERATVERSRCSGAALLETLAAEVESELASRERAQPATGELSAAEHRVLRLLATRLTQREIAAELYVSPNTVKTHARVIYRKLGACSRPAAVSAARELNLL